MIKYILIGLLFSIIAYAECDTSIEKLPRFNRTMDTIGDSLTWNLEGNKLRCLLDSKNFNYDFIGAYIDGYGYHHDGQGGDTSKDVLSRIDSIPYSDNYFLLIGVNDIPKTAQYTYNNIIKISELLHKKNPSALIYVSTLLPTDDYHNIRNNEVNILLRNKLDCYYFELIDLGAYFSSIPNWEQLMIDGVHPTLEGYNKITDYLITVI